MLGARPGEGEWSAAGDVLNTAARIQSAAPIDGILVSRTTYLATMDSFAFSAAEPIQAKGKAEPVEVWEVVGAQDEAAPERAARLSSSAARRSSTSSPRSATSCRRSVRPAWRRSSARRASARAAYCSSSCVDSRSASTSTAGKCLSYGEGITYWPSCEIFKSAAGILQSDDRETSAQKLDTFLETLPTDDLDELRTIASALSNLIGIPTTPRGHLRDERDLTGRAPLGDPTRRFSCSRRERPTAVVVEDLHWAEPTLLELLEYLLADERRRAARGHRARRDPSSTTTRPASSAAEGRRRTVDLQTLGRRAGGGAARRTHRRPRTRGDAASRER